MISAFGFESKKLRIRVLVGLAAMLLAVSLVACQQPASSPNVGEGRVVITFEGHAYDGFEDALVQLPPDALLSVGAATGINAPIDDPTVLSIGNLDPSKFVVMRTEPGIPYPLILFVDHQTLLAGGTTPFGDTFSELCPFLTMAVLREGCPGVPPRTPDAQH